MRNWDLVMRPLSTLHLKKCLARRCGNTDLSARGRKGEPATRVNQTANQLLVGGNQRSISVSCFPAKIVGFADV